MNDVIMSRKRWQQILDAQMLIALIVTILEMIPKRERNAGNIFQLVCLVLVIGLNFYVQFKRKNPSKISYEINRWFTLWLLSDLFIDTWLKVGNYFLLNFKQLEILCVLLLWAAYLVLLLPLAVLYAGDLKKWYLRLIAVYLLDQQYGPDQLLLVSKNLRIIHSITWQGVIAALALLILACFLGYAWGYRFNPNLKFVKSRNFQMSIFVIVIAFATIDLFYNAFSDYDKQIWTAFFSYSIDIQSKYLTIPNLTSAIEPGILEKTERYLMVLIFIAGFNRFPKWRVPIAVYASGILFGLSHAGNVGWNGETLSATIAQVIGVMGSGFLWAVLYLYSGKLWLPMIFHFLMDYLADLQSGWNSAGWQFSGWATDYISEILMVAVPLAFTIWMMFGQRRAVLEENANRLLNSN
ncbi:CPBP family intramembrane glutamic endopeptidase [Lactobacillus kitasatonis]|uniref:CPBP family intramembrane glutamic endopeptidase n=1 Tax=Lactobacillus kitasatonis TaxID=237446 RepID=UPI0026ED82B8|nr:CPBP family intramembrane glutamic endopeptidase [Lactobacillus kitasatonis]